MMMFQILVLQHGIGKNAYIYGSDCSTSSSYNHSVVGLLEIYPNSWSDSDIAYSSTCAVFGETNQVANSPSAYWIFDYTVASSAW